MINASAVLIPQANRIDAKTVTLTPTGGRGKEIDPDFLSDLEYEQLFDVSKPFRPEDRIFLPGQIVTVFDDSKLLPEIADVSISAFQEVGETFSLNGDPEYAARRLCTFDDLKFTTTERKLLSFKPNQVQADYLDIILPGWRENFATKRPLTLRGLREFILKPRKLGFSTLILALFFLDTISTPNTQTVIIAHDAATTRKLFDIMRRFYRNLPADKQPKTGYYSRQEIWFRELDSYIYVGTAGSGQYGRGGTVANLHASEAAFWPNPEDIVAGLFESVPASGNIFVESTANGMGNWYEQTYNKSKAGETEYAARFFPWNIANHYRQEAPPEFTPNEEEEKLAIDYGLDREQVFFRRRKKSALGALFEQEFPITDIEAFVSSGSPYFNRVLLNAHYQTLSADRHKPPKDQEYAPLSPQETGLRAKAFPELFGELLRYNRNQIPKLCIWEPPVRGVMYAIGADVAEGNDNDDENDGRDYDAASVVRVDTLEEVAVLRGQWGQSGATYGILLSQLGFFYNLALLGVERNNHGFAVLNTLQNGHPGYEQWIYPPRQPGGGGLYFAEGIDERVNFASQLRKAKRRAQEVVKKSGFHTNPKTRPLILDYLAAMIFGGHIGLNAIQTVMELMTFAKKPGGKSGAEGNAHDDTVFALAIAVWIAQTVDRYNSSESIEDMSGFTASGGSRGLDGLTGLFGGSGGNR